MAATHFERHKRITPTVAISGNHRRSLLDKNNQATRYIAFYAL